MNTATGGTVALPADHPTLDGCPELDLEVVAGVVRSARVGIGMVHRGVEKLFESRDYRSAMALADRHDWLGAFCSEVGLARAVERLAGIRVPERAGLLRVLLCELTRVSHHLAFLAALPRIPDAGPGGGLPQDRPIAGELSWSGDLWQLREETLGLMEQATGHRVHPMFTVVGGVAADLSPQLLAGFADSIGAWRDRLAHLLGDPLAERLTGYQGLGQLSGERALSLGASGPVGRASGLDHDLRRDGSDLPYPPGFTVPVAHAGDALSRVTCLAAEVPVSLDIMEWALGQLAAVSGPVNVRLPKVLRVPEGRVYVAVENPSGRNGYLLVSRNDPMPYRLHLRTAGFAHAAALEQVLPGTPEPAVPAVVASFFLVPGDSDR